MTMSPDRKFSFVTLLFLLFLVSAVRGQPPHRRRSPALNNGIHRRLANLSVPAVSAALGDLLGKLS